MGPALFRILLLLPFLALGLELAARIPRTAARNPWGDVFALFTALLVIIPVLLGPINHKFSTQFLLASGAAAVLALVAIFLDRKKGKNFGGFLKLRETFSWPTLILIVVSSLLIARVAFHISIHDEQSIQSHPSVMARILRDGLPATVISFPEIPLKYHYGFNVLAAAFAYVFQLPAWVGIDGTTIFLWVVTLFTLSNLLTTLGIRLRLHWLAILWILLGAGWLWVLSYFSSLPHPWGTWQHGYLYGRHMKPMILSLFFQHPVALGLPLFFAGVDYWLQFRRQKAGWNLILCLLLGTVLSLAQFVLFAAFLGILAWDFGMDFLRSRLRDPKPLIWGAASFLVILGIGYWLGGFFESDSSYQGGLTRFTWPPGFLRNEVFAAGIKIGAWRGFLWYLLNFGPILFLFPWAVWLALKERRSELFSLFALALAGFLIPQFFQYRLSWDVMKFFMIFDLLSRLTIAVLFLPLLNRKIWRWTLALLVLLSTMVGPAHFLGTLAFHPYEKLSIEAQRITGIPHGPLAREIEPLLKVLRENSSSVERLLANPELSKWIAVYTGQAVLEIDRNTVAFGLKPELLMQRQEEIQRLWASMHPATLHQAKVRWVVLNCSEFEGLPSLPKQNLGAGSASGKMKAWDPLRAGRYCYRIFEVLP